MIDIIPTTLFSALTLGSVLQALFVALLVGFAVQSVGAKGEPILVDILLRLTTGFSILKLPYDLRQEFLLIVATSSSETALPRLIAKMEHLGVSRPVVGIVVPTGYSFNLDGTALNLTMASLFIGNALGTPLSMGQQISLLVFIVVASKGAAGVTGAGLIMAIDRFMSEARALTNFSGNTGATLVIGSWVKEIDRDQVNRVLDRPDPFDDSDMLDEKLH